MPVSKRFHAPRWLLGACLAMAAGMACAARPATTDDPLAATLAGEYALQAGQLQEATRWYLQAARAAEGDAGLAERATRIALLADEEREAAEALALWRQRAPRSPAMRAADATLALRRKDVRHARSELQALMRDAGADGWRQAVVALGGGKDPVVSARVLGGLLDDGAIPTQLQAWLAFGLLAQRLEQPALGERIVAEVVQRFPGEPRVALLRASQLREAGKPDEARKALAAMSDATLQSPELRGAIASEYEALGDLKTAAATLARGTQDNDSYRMRAALLARAEDNTALTALYDQARGDANASSPDRLLLLGQVAEFLKRYDDALEWYGRVPGGNERWQARLRSAYALHSLKRGDEAFAGLRTLQADASAGEDVQRDAYLVEADLHAKDDPRSPAELDAFARGLAAFPDDGALLYARALGYERRDDIPRAEADLRKLLAADPENVAALNALGYTLADRTTRYREALELIDRARVAEPESPAIIDSYGWVLYRLGRTREALVELKRAYGLQKDPEIASHVGEVLWVLGERDEARRYFDEARKLDPDNRSLQRALQKTGA